MERSTFARARSTANAARPGGVRTVAPNTSTAFWVPPSWRRAIFRVLPLPPEFVAPDESEKQLERNAAKRWLARHGPAVAQLRPVYLGDDLFACQPIAEAIHQAGGSFILTCKPASHQTVSEYLHGATLEDIAGPRLFAANGPRGLPLALRGAVARQR